MEPPKAATKTLKPVHVTGQREKGYAVSKTKAATKTDTAILDTPMSVQVIPQQVLVDQHVVRLKEATDNVSGVYLSSIFQGQSADDFVIRGFRTDEQVYRDGYKISTGEFGKRDLANIEQIEILKGPASILYGRMEPGGMVNYVTKAPEATPHYALEQQFGSYDFYRTTGDATGKLDGAGKLTYRLNFSFERGNSFREFVKDHRWFVAPVLQWAIDDDTTLKLEYDHFDLKTTPDNIGLIAYGDRPLNIPISRNLAEPTDFQNSREDNYAVTLTHAFSEAWTIKARLNQTIGDEEDGGSYGDFVTDADIDAGILPRAIEGSQTGLGETIHKNVFGAELDLTGKFNTGPVKHVLLMGSDFYRDTGHDVCCNINGFFVDDINIFAPVHGVLTGPVDPSFAALSKHRTTSYGIYVQDQIELPGHIHVLAGGRYDHSAARSNGGPETRDHQLSPHYGVLWQPLEWLSFYGSYVENFGASNATLIDRSGTPLKPETAQQWEGGIKTSLLGDRLIGSIAYFHLTKQNIAVTDPLFPIDPDHALAIGEAESKGIEVDLSGEVTPGWNILLAYAYTETKVLDDSFLGTTGNHFTNVPKNGGKVWTTYTVQSGPLSGLTLGGGVTARSNRWGDWNNDFILPGYARVDLMARYSFTVSGTKLTAQINVENLLDKTYYESSGDFGRSRIAPGAPRSVFGSIRAEF